MTVPLTGYNPKVPPSGIGGRQREATMMANVDKMAGGPAHPAATAPAPAPKAVVHPAASSFAPAAPTPGPKVFGSPIEGNAASK